MKKLSLKNSGFTLVELLVGIGIAGTLAGLLLPAVARAKAKANRVKCTSNLSQIGKAFTGFADDNNGRLPWQLTPSQRKNHFGHYYEEELGAIFSLASIKDGLASAKILLSPCDAEGRAANEEAQANWGEYDTRRGTKLFRPAISYLLVRGADMGRSGTVFGTTRNLSDCSLEEAHWSGADESSPGEEVMTGLNRSQGQMVLADGSASQSTDADLGPSGKRVLSHINSVGGVTKGKADTHLIGCGSIMDLMIIYSPKVLAAKLYGDHQGIVSAAKHAVAEVNTGLSRSAACAQFRLVAVEQTPFPSTGNIGKDLHKVRADPYVYQLRTQHKADLVTFLSDAPGGGVGFMGGGRSCGFNVIAHHTMLGGWTIGHELGHNMGCPHHTGHAFRTGDVGYYTVMSMGPGAKGKSHPHVRYRGLLQYSNPGVDYAGVSSGTSANNNAGIIKRNARWIARNY
jgi:prepilin-type N-terminal cleavage/methylation domain-containing protein